MIAVLIDDETALSHPASSHWNRADVLGHIAHLSSRWGCDIRTARHPSSDRSCFCWHQRTAGTPPFGHPHRSFGELEALRQLEQLGVGETTSSMPGSRRTTSRLTSCGITARRHPRPAMELEPGVVHQDEVGRRHPTRTVDAEHRELDLLSWLARRGRRRRRFDAFQPITDGAAGDCRSRAAVRRRPRPRRNRRPTSRIPPCAPAGRRRRCARDSQAHAIPVEAEVTWARAWISWRHRSLPAGVVEVARASIGQMS